MTEELKPCPFCGQIPNIHDDSSLGDMFDPPCPTQYFIRHQCEKTYESTYLSVKGRTPEEVARKWNKRHPS